MKLTDDPRQLDLVEWIEDHMKKHPEGIFVRCVQCKATRFLSSEEAQALTHPPLCAECNKPMIVVSAAL